MFNPDAECEFKLPGDQPQTVVYYTAYTQDDQTINQTNGARLARAEVMLGREADDPSAVKKISQSDRASVATRIIRIENLRDPGDCITDKQEIEAFLAKLGVTWYARLTNAMGEALGTFEKKA